ncbi:hypothetical protein [uncultured Parasphingorhabdus sp.]|uniref:hypothetical protein n=1 Tax=uncultured Parasphingorhabdus sp. TaxID=2709694 RepID=UPI0030D8EA05|tara:strand:+ start:34847 stop:35329 length:483 start_codon:yes stop_codon:yes gene_type:complete
MKKYLIIPALVLISACSGGESSDSSSQAVETDTMPSSGSAAAVPEAAIAQPRLAFDIPIMDGARYISGSPEFSKPSKRHGGEAIATIAYKGTPLDIVNFYERALAEDGFTPTLGQHNDEAIATVTGVRENGEKIMISTSRGGSKARDGESTAAIIATKPL